MTWGLRDYGTASWDGGDPECEHKPTGHASRPELKAQGLSTWTSREYSGSVSECRCGARRIDQQIGLEATPAEYIARMVAVFSEVRRVLRSDGTCWVNIGDSYAASTKGAGGEGKQHTNAGSVFDDRTSAIPPGLKPKDLIGMPWRLAFALQEDGWWLRSDIIWSKPNPMPESVTDRPTKAHEYVFLLTKAARYYYDADAIREAAEWARWGKQTIGKAYRGINPVDMDSLEDRREQGRNARSVWTIATQPYAEAHFATFPEELPRRCILAGTSERGVCPDCGAPWSRVVERGESDYARLGKQNGADFGRNDSQPGNKGQTRTVNGSVPSLRAASSVTTGWAPTCTHGGEPIPATVLDPFSGSGTTLMVAVRHGRSAIGIELNPEYVAMARRRIVADAGAEPEQAAEFGLTAQLRMSFANGAAR